MDPFERIAIGNTGVEVTRLGLGGAPLSGMEVADGPFGGSRFQVAVGLIRHAYKLGIRYFDTAPLYGAGRSEARYGQSLSGHPRSSFTISTKTSRVLRLLDPKKPEPRGEDGIPAYTCVFDFSGDGIRASLASSLERLKLDSVDILFVHDSDERDQHSDEEFVMALQAAIELREERTVRAIGMGMNEWEKTARMVERFDLDFILLAGRYSLLDQSALPQFLPLCLERGVKLVIGGPYNSGILASDLDGPVLFDYRRAPKHLIAKARRIKTICGRHGVELRAAALQFPLAHDAVISVIPGAASIAQVEDNVRVMQAEIPGELWTDLKADGLLPEAAPTPLSNNH